MRNFSFLLWGEPVFQYRLYNKKPGKPVLQESKRSRAISVQENALLRLSSGFCGGFTTPDAHVDKNGFRVFMLLKAENGRGARK